MPVYPVDASPKFISGVNTQPYILKNSGASTVYIGQDSSLTVASRAFSITAGGVLQWPGEASEIWACTATGETSELEILYNSQAQYTPGPENVTVTGEVDATIVGAITISGRSNLLYNAPTNNVPQAVSYPAYLDGVQATVQDLPSDTQTIRIRTMINNVIGGIGGVPYRFYLYLQWLSSSGVELYTEAVSGIYGHTAIATIPKRSDRVRVLVVNPANNQPAVTTINVQVAITAFGVDLPAAYESRALDPMNDGGILETVSNPQLGANQSLNRYLTQAPAGIRRFSTSSYGGLNNVYVHAHSVTGGGTLTVGVYAIDPDPYGSVGAQTASDALIEFGPLAPDAKAMGQLVLPNLPIMVFVQRNGGSAAINCRAIVNFSSLPN